MGGAVVKRCYCPACRARDARDFDRIIGRTWTRTAATLVLIRETDRAISETVRARIGRYGMPALPTWDGEPAELRLPPYGNPAG